MLQHIPVIQAQILGSLEEGPFGECGFSAPRVWHSSNSFRGGMSGTRHLPLSTSALHGNILLLSKIGSSATRHVLVPSRGCCPPWAGVPPPKQPTPRLLMPMCACVLMPAFSILATIFPPAPGTVSSPQRCALAAKDIDAIEWVPTVPPQWTIRKKESWL